MAWFILDNETLGLQYVAEPLGWIFLIFPHYSLARGISNLYIKQSTINICDTQCSYFPECRAIGVPRVCESAAIIDCSDGNIVDSTMKLICDLRSTCCDRNFFDVNKSSVGIQLIALAIVGVASFAILFAIEFRWIQNLYAKAKGMIR